MEIEFQGERIGNTEKAVLSGNGMGPASPATEGQGALAWVMLAVGYCYIDFIFTRQLGLGVLLFTLFFCITAAVYMQKNGFHQTGVSGFYLAAAGLSAVSLVLFDHTVMGFWNLQFLKMMAVYWICVTTGRRIGGSLSAYTVGDFINQTLLIPFGNFGRQFASLFHTMERKKGTSAERKEARKGRLKNFMLACGGLLLVLPILIWVIELLTTADAAFSELISRLDFSWNITLPTQLARYFVTFLLGVPVSCYLFGLLYGNGAKRQWTILTKESLDRGAEGVRILPKIMGFTAVGALILVYALFFATQAVYLFSAFRSQLPVSMTYAEYARRGFFELCTVAAINLSIIGLVGLFSCRDGKKSGLKDGDGAGELDGKERGHETRGTLPGMIKAEILALCVLTMMLIATAVSKMAMYIHSYGLTQLRFYTTAFMLILFLCFVIILVRQLREFNCGKFLILVCMVGFLLVSYSNVDSFIAKYNIGRYQSGTLETLDVMSIGQLSAAAVPELCALYEETEDPDLKLDIFLALGTGLQGQNLWENRDFREWNYQRDRAAKALDQVKWDESTLQRAAEYFGT